MTVKKILTGQEIVPVSSACLPTPDAGCDRGRLFAEGACEPGEGAGTAGGVLLALQPGQSVRAYPGLGRQFVPGLSHAADEAVEGAYRLQLPSSVASLARSGQHS